MQPLSPNWCPIRRNCLGRGNAIRAAGRAARRCRHRDSRRRCAANSAEAHCASAGCCRRSRWSRRRGETGGVWLSSLMAPSRVTLFCGCRLRRGARRLLCSLARRSRARIVHALGGKEQVEFDNPFDVGMTGFIGFVRLCRDACVRRAADAGHGLSLQAGLAGRDRRSRLAGELGRRCKLDLGLVGDVGATIDAPVAETEGGK